MGKYEGMREMTRHLRFSVVARGGISDYIVSLDLSPAYRLLFGDPVTKLFLCRHPGDFTEWRKSYGISRIQDNLHQIKSFQAALSKGG